MYPTRPGHWDPTRSLSAEALQTAAATSGRAVLFSGFVVMTAMAGMFLMGSKTFASFGVGTVLVVAIALLGSLTVMPAVLSKLGDRVERGRIPLLARLGGRDRDSRLWGAVIGAVMRHPPILGGAAAAVLVALALPALTLHTVDSGVQGLPRDLPVSSSTPASSACSPAAPVLRWWS